MTIKLNALGPPTRTTDAWKKVNSSKFQFQFFFLNFNWLQILTSNKSKAKAKLGAQHLAGKFNIARRKPLSPLSNSIIKSAGLQAAVEGLNVKSFGVKIRDEEEDYEDEVLQMEDVNNGDEVPDGWKNPSYGEM